MYDITRPLRRALEFVRYDVPYGVENLIRWFPVVWYDRSWDHRYIYSILIRKLEIQSRHLRRFSDASGADDDADRMDRCVELLRRIRDEASEVEAHDAHEAVWGELSMEMIPLEDPYYCSAVKDMVVCTAEFSRPKAVTPEEVAREREEYSERMAAAREKAEAEKDEMYTILREYLEEWWW